MGSQKETSLLIIFYLEPVMAEPFNRTIAIAHVSHVNRTWGWGEWGGEREREGTFGENLHHSFSKKIPSFYDAISETL